MKTLIKGIQDGGCTHSYFGVVNTLTEAHLLLEAAKVGIVPRVSRRLSDAEKVKYVKPGAVFLFEEEESGILRWTDHYRWSPSRVSGSFLLYTAIELPSAVHVDDTLIKQSFFSVDATGARMHLIAYSSRRYRLGEGAHQSVSEDATICDQVTVAKTTTPLPLRPRVVSTSHCFALVRTAPSVSRPITFDSGSAYTHSPLTLSKDSYVPSLRVEAPTQSFQHQPPQALAMLPPPTSLLPPRPLVNYSPPLPSRRHSLSDEFVAKPRSERPIPLGSHTLPFFTDIHRTISRQLPTPSSSSTSSASSSRSRSITPTTPVLQPLSPPVSPKRGLIASLGTHSSINRYNPYSSQARSRIAPVSTVHRSSSFDAISDRARNHLEFKNEVSFRGGSEKLINARAPEDTRVLALLGKFSMNFC